MSLKLSELETHLLRHRKTWVIGGGIVFLFVLTGLYVWGSMKAWDNFETGNLVWYGEIKDRSKKIFAVEVKKSADKARKQREIDDLGTTIQRASDRCNFSMLFSWQQFIQLNKERMQECRQLLSKTAVFGKSLNVVSEHLRSENNVALIITNAAKTIGEVDETKWPVVMKQWADAETSLRKLAVGTSFSTTKDLAVGKAKSIHSAWNALIVANNAKDLAKYEDADAMLTRTYGTLDEITQSSEAKLLPLLAALDHAYAKAYK